MLQIMVAELFHENRVCTGLRRRIKPPFSTRRFEESRVWKKW